MPKVTRTSHLKLVPIPQSASARQAVMPSRKLSDGSIVFGLVEDPPPPYLVCVSRATCAPMGAPALSGKQ